MGRTSLQGAVEGRKGLSGRLCARKERGKSEGYGRKGVKGGTEISTVKSNEELYNNPSAWRFL